MTRSRVALLTALLLLTLVTPPAAAVDIKPDVYLELDFDTTHHAQLDLEILAGEQLVGNGTPQAPAELVEYNFTNEPLTLLTRALAADLDGNFSAQLLVGQLLFGYLGYDTVNFTQLNVQKVRLHPNGFHLQASVELGTGLDPVKLRPLYCLYDNPDIDVNQLGRKELSVSTSGGVALDTGAFHLNHFRWLREDGALGETLSNQDLYLDPTDIFGIGAKYDLHEDSITVVAAQPYTPGRVLAEAYLGALVLSLLLIKVLGRKTPSRKGRRLAIGVYRWMFAALLYPLAFLPNSAEIFLAAVVLNLLWCAQITFAARRRHKRKYGAGLGAGKPSLIPVDDNGIKLEKRIDGSDTQITDEVVPGERELLDELLAESQEARSTAAVDNPPQWENQGKRKSMTMERPEFGSVGFDGVVPGPQAGAGAGAGAARCDNCGASMQEGWISCPVCDSEQGKVKPREETSEVPATPNLSDIDAAAPDLPATPDLPAELETPPAAPETPAGGEDDSLDDLFGKLDSLDELKKNLEK